MINLGDFVLVDNRLHYANEISDIELQNSRNTKFDDVADAESIAHSKPEYRNHRNYCLDAYGQVHELRQRHSAVKISTHHPDDVIPTRWDIHGFFSVPGNAKNVSIIKPVFMEDCYWIDKYDKKIDGKIVVLESGEPVVLDKRYEDHEIDICADGTRIKDGVFSDITGSKEHIVNIMAKNKYLLNEFHHAVINWDGNRTRNSMGCGFPLSLPPVVYKLEQFHL